ncbi:hypothetical protein QZH41_008716, partial [Actinostola sp. cb2023]
PLFWSYLSCKQHDMSIIWFPWLSLFIRSLCPNCFFGDNCNKYTDDVILMFPNKVIKQKVVYENPFPSLTAFTVSMWVQFDPSTEDHVILSYATHNSNNELYFGTETKKMILLIKSKFSQSR